MIESSVIHDTFAIERTFLALRSRVFAAFASSEARKIWFCGSPGEAAGEGPAYELDFRVGGRERFRFRHHDRIVQFRASFYDILPDHRIIYSYEMYSDGVRISVSVATLEFAENGDGTALVWTEQGAFLDGFEGADAPKLREEGTRELFDDLASYLDSQAPQ